MRIFALLLATASLAAHDGEHGHYSLLEHVGHWLTSHSGLAIAAIILASIVLIARTRRLRNREQ